MTLDVCEIGDAEVGFMWRKLGSVAKPDIIISVDGDRCTIKSQTSFTTSETTFQLGSEFEDTTPDGRKIAVSVEVDSVELNPDSSLDVLSVRHFSCVVSELAWTGKVKSTVLH